MRLVHVFPKRRLGGIPSTTDAVFGLMVMSALGFKTRVDSLIHLKLHLTRWLAHSRKSFCTTKNYPALQ